MRSGRNISPRLQSRVSPRATGISGNRGSDDMANRQRRYEHRIQIQNEESNLLEYEVVTGMLVLDKITTDSRFSISLSCLGFGSKDSVEAKLTRTELTYGSNIIYLDDVISVSYNAGHRLFTVHTYPVKRSSCGLRFWRKTRARKDFSFLASSSDQVYDWASGFAQHNCILKNLTVTTDFHLMGNIISKSPPKVLVILNPKSGRGYSSHVFKNAVEPIFKTAGFQMEVVETKSAGHAKSLVATVDFDTCPDGIICIGGDGIVNEVLNGLLVREDQQRAISIPMGIIPAGSDNSLVWTVLGDRDPASAAISIVKGGVVPTDILVVEWLQTGLFQFGMTVSYFGFVSDALQLSQKYQKYCGPLRYIFAGIQKFFCLPDYSFEVEYLPIENDPFINVSAADGRELENLQGQAAAAAAAPPPVETAVGGVGDHEPPHVCSEQSDYDPKCKQEHCSSSSSGRRRDVWEEAEVLHPQTPRPTTARTRSKTTPPGAGAPSSVNRLEESNPIMGSSENWVTARGQFLGILICNHECRTVQNASQVVAPRARHDDRSLDLMMIRGRGRLRLLIFFIQMHLGQHLTLPFVDYVKVKSVKVKQSNDTKTGCGIDGEMLPMNGQLVTSLFPYQCFLMGRVAK